MDPMMLSPLMQMANDEHLPTPPPSSESALQQEPLPVMTGIQPLRLAPSPFLQPSTSSPPVAKRPLMVALPSKPKRSFPGGPSRKSSLPSPPSSDPVLIQQTKKRAPLPPTKKNRLKPPASVKFSDSHKGSANGSPHHRKWLPFVRSPVRRAAALNLNSPPALAPSSTLEQLLESPSRRGGPRITLSSSPLRRHGALVREEDEEEDDVFTDNSSTFSDDDVRETLIPHLFMRSTRPSSASHNPSLPPSSPDRDRDPTDRRVRSILKRPSSSSSLASTISFGDDLEKCTLANGKRRTGLGGNVNPAGRATGKALMRVLAGDAEPSSSDPLGSAAGGEGGPSKGTGGANGTGRLLPAASTTGGLRGDGDDDGDDDPPNHNNPDLDHKGKSRAPSLSSARLTTSLTDIRLSLSTLSQSLLPPPTEMRLDPLSPLVRLATPQRRRLDEMGRLVGSPREPKDLLPRQRVVFPTSLPLPPEDMEMREPSTPELRAGEGMEGESQKTVVTLRDVEDAYYSLTTSLELLLSSEEGEGKVVEKVAEVLEEFEGELGRCCVRELGNLVDLPSGSSEEDDGRPHRERSLSSSIEKAKASKGAAASDGAGGKGKEGKEGGGGKDKGGASTSQIRRKTAEIDAGQAVVRCLSVLLSVPAWVQRLADADLSTILCLTLRIPETQWLLKKKHLLILACQNRLLAKQKLPPRLLGPLCPAIVSSVTTSLYSQGGKSNERGRKVLVEGFGAIASLAIQIPSAFIPHFGRFFEALLAGLTSPNAALRWAAVGALGAIVRGLQGNWEGGPTPGDAGLVDMVDVDRESLRQQISCCTLAYLQRMSPRDELKLLDQQIGKAIVAGEFGWACCTIATVIAILGKRYRKMEADGPKMFTQRMQELIKKPNNVACRTLGYQLWDCVLHCWLLCSVATKNSNRVWALEGKPFDYALQIITNGASTFWNPVPQDSLPSVASVQHMTSTSQRIVTLLYAFLGYTVCHLTPVDQPGQEPVRFAYYDVIWKRIVAFALPNMLDSASDECRVMAWEILAALLDSGEESSQRSRPGLRPWTMDRLLNQAFLEPPTSAAPPESSLDELLANAAEDPITIDELPTFDCEWICSRAKLVLPKLGVALVAARSMRDVDKIDWTRTSDGYPICPVIFTTAWRRYLASLRAARAASPAIEPLFRKAVRDVMLGIKNVIGPGNCPVRPSADDPASPLELGIRIFLHLYHLSHETLGAEVVSQLALTWPDGFEDCPVSYRLVAFMLDDGPPEAFEGDDGSAGQLAYLDALTLLLRDAEAYVSVSQLVASWRMCQQPRFLQAVASVAVPSLYRRFSEASQQGLSTPASDVEAVDIVRLALETRASGVDQAFGTRILELVHLLMPATRVEALLNGCAGALTHFFASEKAELVMPVYTAILQQLEESDGAALADIGLVIECFATPLQNIFAGAEATAALKTFWLSAAGMPIRERLAKHPSLTDILVGLEIETQSQSQSQANSLGVPTQVASTDDSSVGSMRFTQLFGGQQPQAGGVAQEHAALDAQPDVAAADDHHQDQPAEAEAEMKVTEEVAADIEEEPEEEKAVELEAAAEVPMEEEEDEQEEPAKLSPMEEEEEDDVSLVGDTAQIIDFEPDALSVSESEAGDRSGESSAAEFLPDSFEESVSARVDRKRKAGTTRTKKRKSGPRLSMPRRKKSRSASVSSEVAPEDEDVILVPMSLAVKRELERSRSMTPVPPASLPATDDDDDDELILQPGRKIRRESSSNSLAAPLVSPARSSDGKSRGLQRHHSKDSLVFKGLAIPSAPARQPSKSPPKHQTRSQPRATSVPKIEVQEDPDNDSDEDEEVERGLSQAPMREDDDTQVIARKLKGWGTQSVAKLNRVASGVLEKRSAEPEQKRRR